MIAKADQLSLTEIDRLAKLESVVQKNLVGFAAAGEALTEIRDKRLYRSDFETFEEYCGKKWGLKRQRAYELMDAAEIASNLSEISDTRIRESHAAELKNLPAEEQREAWQEAVATAPEGKVTAKHVAEVVARRRGDDDDESGKDFAANAPLRALEKAGPASLGKTPKEEADSSPEKRWHLVLHDLYKLINSIRDIGGIKSLAKSWTKDGRKQAADDLREIEDKIRDYRKALELK